MSPGDLVRINRGAPIEWIPLNCVWPPDPDTSATTFDRDETGTVLRVMPPKISREIDRTQVQGCQLLTSGGKVGWVNTTYLEVMK